MIYDTCSSNIDDGPEFAGMHEIWHLQICYDYEAYSQFFLRRSKAMEALHHELIEVLQDDFDPDYLAQSIEDAINQDNQLHGIALHYVDLLPT